MGLWMVSVVHLSPGGMAELVPAEEELMGQEQRGSRCLPAEPVGRVFAAAVAAVGDQHATERLLEQGREGVTALSLWWQTDE